MSRIHEALKRAESERAGAPPADTINTDPRVAAGTEKRPGGAFATTQLLTPPAIGVPGPGDPLRFDDLRAHCSRPQWHPDENMNVFCPGLSPHSAEQFRTLRSRLYQLRSGQSLRRLLITSSIAAEGKTFVTANLGRALARQAERRVLIIDGDLRSSRLHVPFGAPTTPGLSNYLCGEVDEFGVIQNGHENNLCFIPGGKRATNPSELLANGRLKTLLDRVGSAFDWIIFDSPPCLPVADANVLADFCDGVLLVVKAASTPLAVVQRACQELQGRNVAGVVLNSIDEDTLASYGTYYGSTPYGYEDLDGSKHVQ